MTDRLEDAPPHLLRFLEQHGVAAEFLAPGAPVPTVASAAAAIGVPEEQILKTLLFVDDDGAHVVAIVNGARRVAREQLAAASGLRRLRTADPATVLDVTGFPAGGVSPLGLPANLPVIVDSTVSALSEAYGGGGQTHLLLRLAPSDIIRLNNALVAAIGE